METEEVIGYVTGIIGIFLFGTYTVPLKFMKGNIYDRHPIILQFCNAWILCLSSLFLLTYYDYSIIPDLKIQAAGLITAIIWTIANPIAYYAVQLIGIGIAISIWVGISIVVSFLWGQIAFQSVNQFENSGIAIMSIIILVISVGITSTLDTNVHKKNLEKNDENENKDDKDDKDDNKQKIIGITCAVIMGILNGTMFVPIQFLTADNNDKNTIVYMIPYGYFSVLLSAIELMFYGVYVKHYGHEIKFYFKNIVMVCLSGFMLILGYFCANYAITFLGISLGFPLIQGAIIVCGIWSIIFKEFDSKKDIITLINLMIIMIIAIIILSLAR